MAERVTDARETSRERYMSREGSHRPYVYDRPTTPTFSREKAGPSSFSEGPKRTSAMSYKAPVSKEKAARMAAPIEPDLPPSKISSAVAYVTSPVKYITSLFSKIPETSASDTVNKDKVIPFKIKTKDISKLKENKKTNEQKSVTKSKKPETVVNEKSADEKKRVKETVSFESKEDVKKTESSTSRNRLPDDKKWRYVNQSQPHKVRNRSVSQGDSSSRKSSQAHVAQPFLAKKNKTMQIQIESSGNKSSFLIKTPGPTTEERSNSPKAGRHQKLNEPRYAHLKGYYKQKNKDVKENKESGNVWKRSETSIKPRAARIMSAKADKVAAINELTRGGSEYSEVTGRKQSARLMRGSPDLNRSRVKQLSPEIEPSIGGVSEASTRIMSKAFKRANKSNSASSNYSPVRHPKDQPPSGSDIETKLGISLSSIAAKGKAFLSALENKQSAAPIKNDLNNTDTETGISNSLNSKNADKKNITNNEENAKENETKKEPKGSAVFKKDDKGDNGQNSTNKIEGSNEISETLKTKPETQVKEIIEDVPLQTSPPRLQQIQKDGGKETKASEQRRRPTSRKRTRSNTRTTSPSPTPTSFRVRHKSGSRRKGSSSSKSRTRKVRRSRSRSHGKVQKKVIPQSNNMIKEKSASDAEKVKQEVVTSNDNVAVTGESTISSETAADVKTNTPQTESGNSKSEILTLSSIDKGDISNPESSEGKSMDTFQNKKQKMPTPCQTNAAVSSSGSVAATPEESKVSETNESSIDKSNEALQEPVQKADEPVRRRTPELVRRGVDPVYRPSGAFVRKSGVNILRNMGEPPAKSVIAAMAKRNMDTNIRARNLTARVALTRKPLTYGDESQSAGILNPVILSPQPDSQPIHYKSICGDKSEKHFNGSLGHHVVENQSSNKPMIVKPTLLSDSDDDSSWQRKGYISRSRCWLQEINHAVCDDTSATDLPADPISNVNCNPVIDTLNKKFPTLDFVDYTKTDVSASHLGFGTSWAPTLMSSSIPIVNLSGGSVSAKASDSNIHRFSPRNYSGTTTLSSSECIDSPAQLNSGQNYSSVRDDRSTPSPINGNPLNYLAYATMYGEIP